MLKKKELNPVIASSTAVRRDSAAAVHCAQGPPPQGVLPPPSGVVGASASPSFPLSRTQALSPSSARRPHPRWLLCSRLGAARRRVAPRPSTLAVVSPLAVLLSIEGITGQLKIEGFSDLLFESWQLCSRASHKFFGTHKGTIKIEGLSNLPFDELLRICGNVSRLSCHKRILDFISWCLVPIVVMCMQ
ncbi:hypothetical protein AHAS_Ahas17G0041000 [Arachis hypogaea]